MSRVHFFLAALSLAVVLTAATASTSPSLVINIFRHGARGPLKNDVDSTWDPSQYGMLTAAGKRMQYILGAALAKTYPDLLSGPYDSSEIYVRTSQATRCIESVTNQVYGAFGGYEPELDDGYQPDIAVPPFNSDIIQEVLEDLSYSQPGTGDAFDIVMDSVPVQDDIVLETPKTCPALYSEALGNILSLNAADLWFSLLSPTRSALKAAGLSDGSPLAMNEIADAFHCDHYQERPLPGGFTSDSDVYKDTIFAAAFFTVLAEYTGTKQKELLSVPLFDEIFQIFDAKIAGTSTYQFAFLSTHDVTLLTILSALDLVNTDCMMANYKSVKAGGDTIYPHCHFPDFASNIILELYESDGNPYIVFKYDDQIVPVCGGDDCSYEDFKSLVSDATNGYTVWDYKATCLNYLANGITDVKSYFADRI